MPKRTKNQNTLVLGEWNVLCDVCGFKFKSSDVKERWDGLYVCKDDWEVRHPSDFFRARKEDQSTQFTRPEDSGQQADGSNTDISGDTFPDPENTSATTDVPSSTFNISDPIGS